MDEYNANEQFLTTYQAYYNKPIEHFSQKTYSKVFNFCAVLISNLYYNLA